MYNFLLYLLKVSAGITLFYLCYLLLFRMDTFYLRNRIFLILTLLLPTILPAIKIPILSNSFAPAGSANVIDNIIFSGTATVTTISGTINSFDYNRLFVWIYFTVTGLLILRVAVSLISTYRIIKKGTVKNRRFPKVIISDNQLPPFSFFPYAVIPAEYYNNGNYIDILDHEFAHIREGHTFDLLLSELFIALQWFNPFVWLIKKSIILNHEYLADHVSISKNRSVKEYQYRLLSFQAGLRHISLAHNFNSLIKNRIIMINKKPTRKYATLKNILILPVVAIVAYAFATPEYHYASAKTDDKPLNIYQSPVILQKEVKGIVIKEDGKPLEGVNITSTGTMGNASMATTNRDGRFLIMNVQDDASLLFFCRGYKQLTLNPDFNKEMSIKMVKNPDYKEAVEPPAKDTVSIPKPLVTWDGQKSDQTPKEIFSKMGANIGTIKELKGKEATDKYGDAGKNGVLEFYSIEKATELKLIPFRRTNPEDFPTFQGKNYLSFNDWVISQVKYPSEATSRGIRGHIMVNYTVEAEGSIGNVSPMGTDPLLVDAVVKVIQSSPKWEPAKNPKAYGPFEFTVSVKFELPDKILNDDVYVMVENMPEYPGGAMELLKFLAENTNYPESAKKERIEGKVIVRFIVNKEGNVEEPVVLKGVHPLLDAEAIKVAGMLKGFRPGTQGGDPVNVYYMIPISFVLPSQSPPR